jgi:hypothetical protein
MIGQSILGYFLALWAIGGLALAPMVRPAMAAPILVPMAMDVHASARDPMAAGPVVAEVTDDMPCCPHKPSLPDCSKDCPLMALCVTAPLHFASQTGLIAPFTFVTVVFPGDQSDLASVAYAPPRKPPKI